MAIANNSDLAASDLAARARQIYLQTGYVVMGATHEWAVGTVIHGDSPIWHGDEVAAGFHWRVVAQVTRADFDCWVQQIGSVKGKRYETYTHFYKIEALD